MNELEQSWSKVKTEHLYACCVGYIQGVLRSSEPEKLEQIKSAIDTLNKIIDSRYHEQSEENQSL